MPFNYGWKPSRPDQRDRLYAFSIPLNLIPLNLQLPSSASLRSQSPGVFDQGDLGSCVGNATALALWFNQRKAKGPTFVPSRLFIYYNARDIEGETGYDAGAYIRDAMKSVGDLGCAAEGRNTSGSWEYTRDYRQRPSKAAYNHALNHQAIVYRSVPQLPGSIRAALAGGHPVVFGFSVYESFESDAVAQTGVVPMPQDNESVVGGHAVCLMGYDNAVKRYLCQNSWGTGWGDGGFFTIPYDYVHDSNLADDFWIVTDQELGAVSG